MQGAATPPQAGFSTGGGIFVTHQHGLPGYQVQSPGNGPNDPWSTGDCALDDWLRRSFFLDDIFQGLARLSMPERKKIALAVSGKVDSIRDPPKYLMGCIRKSLEQPSPYSSFTQMPLGVGGLPVCQADVHSVPRPLFATSEASGSHSAGLGSSMVAAQGSVLTNGAEQVSVPITPQPTVARATLRSQIISRM